MFAFILFLPNPRYSLALLPVSNGDIRNLKAVAFLKNMFQFPSQHSVTQTNETEVGLLYYKTQNCRAICHHNS